jgi:Domain of unknown function (DUF222)/HNH endonuclease
MPTERLEAEITTLAGHLNAATCRWLSLVAEFDRREGHVSWGCASCAHWLSWQCGITPGAAREQLRVARCLLQLPEIQGAFAAGRLSFSQARALTRVATPENEGDLLQLASHATAAQLERIVRGYRKADDLSREAEAAHEAREVFYWHDDDGSLVIHARLPAAEGELVLQALNAAEATLTADDGDVSAETRPSPGQRRADALVAMAETTLSSGLAPAAGGERHQVVVHVDIETLAADEPGRCELADGTAIGPETARRLACDGALVKMTHGKRGPPNVGRRTRTVPAAIRRALDARDAGCRFPGCTRTRFVDAHHIHHWAHGGPTSVDNLVLLCRHHHRLLHEGRYSLTRTTDGELTFRRPDRRKLRAVCPALTGNPTALHDGHRDHGPMIHPDTATTGWMGDPLDLPLTTYLLHAKSPPRSRSG